MNGIGLRRSSTFYSFAARPCDGRPQGKAFGVRNYDEAGTPQQPQEV